MKKLSELELQLQQLCDVYEELELENNSLEQTVEELKTALVQLEQQSDTIKTEADRISFDMKQLDTFILNSFLKSEVAFSEENLSQVEKEDTASQMFFNLSIGLNALTAAAHSILSQDTLVTLQSEAKNQSISEMFAENSINYARLPAFILSTAAICAGFIKLRQIYSGETDHNTNQSIFNFTNEQGVSDFDALLLKFFDQVNIAGKLDEEFSRKEYSNLTAQVEKFTAISNNLENKYSQLEANVVVSIHPIVEFSSAPKWDSLAKSMNTIDIAKQTESMVQIIESMEEKRAKLLQIISENTALLEQLANKNNELSQQNNDLDKQVQSFAAEFPQLENFKKPSSDNNNINNKNFFEELFLHENDNRNELLFKFERAINYWQVLNLKLKDMERNFNNSGELRFKFAKEFSSLHFELMQATKLLSTMLKMSHTITQELQTVINSLDVEAVNAVDENDRKALQEKKLEIEQLLSILEKQFTAEALLIHNDDNVKSDNNNNNEKTIPTYQ